MLVAALASSFCHLKSGLEALRGSLVIDVKCTHRVRSALQIRSQPAVTFCALSTLQLFCMLVHLQGSLLCVL